TRATRPQQRSPPVRTPDRGSRGRGQPVTKGAPLITATPQHVKEHLARRRAGQGAESTTPDLEPFTGPWAAKRRDPDLHGLREQPRAGVDQGLAWLEQDLGTSADAGVTGTVSGGDGVSDEDRAGSALLQLDPDVVLHLGRRGGEARRARPKRIRRDGFGSQCRLVC